MDKTARNDSWDTLPMPDQHTSLYADWTFTEREFIKMSRGLIPKVMEDKWFIFYESGWFNFNRSWTGFCIYKMKVEQNGGVFTVTEILVNRDPEQYLSSDDSHDLEMLRYLIERQLLGSESKFPIRGDIEGKVRAALYRHHIVGHDRSSDEIDEVSE